MSVDDRHVPQQRKLTQEQEWRRFQENFLELIPPSHPEGITIYSFIRRILGQFHLMGLYDPAYILHETYLRAYDYICGDKKGHIHKPTPWIKATALNIVRELSRREGKTGSIEEVSNLEQPTEPSLESQFNIGNEIAFIMLAFQRLRPEDQRILQFVLVEERSYREVRQIYLSEGDVVSEAALRKKKERALKQLRDIYHAMADMEDCL